MDSLISVPLAGWIQRKELSLERGTLFPYDILYNISVAVRTHVVWNIRSSGWENANFLLEIETFPAGQTVAATENLPGGESSF